VIVSAVSFTSTSWPRDELFAPYRVHLAVLLILDTGLRISEALNLRQAGVDCDNLILKVFGKGQKERFRSATARPRSTSCRGSLDCRRLAGTGCGTHSPPTTLTRPALDGAGAYQNHHDPALRAPPDRGLEREPSERVDSESVGMRVLSRVSKACNTYSTFKFSNVTRSRKCLDS
jgi:hypothetical protein